MEKNNYLQISKQVGVSYFFSILTLLSQPLLIIILTKVLSVEEFGIYSLLTVTISLLNLFLRFGLDGYIITKIPGMEEEKRSVTLLIILILNFSLLAIIGTFLFLDQKIFLKILNIEAYSFLWSLSIFLIISITSFDLLNYYFTSIKRIILSSALRFFCQCFWIIILLFFFLTFHPLSLNSIFLLWSTSTFILMIISFFFLKSELKHIINFFFKNSFLQLSILFLKKILSFSLPLVAIGISALILQYSNRFLINYFLGKTNVAIYSLAFNLINFVVFAPTIILSVIQPYFNEKWNIGEDSSLLFNIMLKCALILVLPAMIGIIILRKELILLLSSPEYLSASPLIIVLSIFPLLYIFWIIFSQTFYLRGMLKHLLLINLSGTAINIFFNLIFIPKIGVIAAAYGLVFSFFWIFLALLFYRSQKIIFLWDYFKIKKIFLGSLLMGTAIYPLHLFLLQRLSIWSTIITIIFGATLYTFFLFFFKVFTNEEKALFSQIYRNILPKKDVN